ncbi:T9SS type A sorting domain-containing protein [Bizionia arctica]|uniref:Secretion system C-terminal sorting domain-containing protein n=1 Tax=Bizionia arctica TaxID=1495645 RepID=A0A917LWL5_9FLAO|nr:T9SS type A sorting domain-containing protein [Bizionia arctica]GGG60077.1 hypothetical protein GCM10010976_33530 [Bizionia arctica]
MKKIYLLLVSITFSLLTYGQSPIVTVDRANIAVPTATGNAASISSIGITRGTGVIRRVGTDHTTISWSGVSQATAQTNNDYLQWSVKANTNFEVELTEVDMHLRRNTDGPKVWQLFYSTNGFATAGTAINSPVAMPENNSIVYNLNGLSINSGNSGTITFRLYAWNANTNQGWLRIKSSPTWSEFGISQPGIRLTGNITPASINSAESNIISSISFDPMDDIDYLLYDAPSGLTVSNALKIGEFTIQDGGNDLMDADALPTILEDLSFQVAGSSNFAAISIFDGATNVGEVTSVGTTITFNGINGGTGLLAPDNGSKTFDVYATFGTSITDNEQFQLTVSSAIPDGVNGSTFELSDAGGAQTLIIGDDNRLEVVASQLIFTTQPTDVNQFEIMTPFPIIHAVDINNNFDLDGTGTVSILSAGSLNGAPIDYTILGGVATLNTLIFNETETDINLFAFGSGGLGFVVSDTFNVLGPLITIAMQDFDLPSPEWTYTHDTPFFDNGWGTDGYYGIIDIADAAPLNYPSFTNNILGENDLYDEIDNGTSGFATITFADVDISSFNNVTVQFDWQIIGYVDNGDDAQYELFYDGISQGWVFLLDGNGPVEEDAETIILDIPDSVETVALQIRVSNNGTDGYSGFDNFKVVSVFDGLLYTNSAWTPYPPTNSTGLENAFVKDGTYNVGTNIELNNLVIANGATVSVSNSQSIKLNSDLFTDGLLELNSISNSYSSLIVEGKSTGAVTYNRHVNSYAGNNDLISAPVTGQTFGELANNNPNLYSYPATPTRKLFGPFDKVTGLYLTYDTSIPSDESVVLAPGTGYRAATNDNLNLNFTGIVNTGNVNVPIVIAGPYNPEWNLVGNPYPSYISLSDFLASNNSEFETVSSGVYGYDGNASDGWNIWNQAYSDANPAAVMAPGQGFLVASKTGGGTISFSPSMRSIGTTDDFIPGRMATEPIEHLKLELSSTDKLYKTDFYFTNNATLGLDPGYDSNVFGGSAPAFSIYSQLVEDNTGNAIAIQSLGYLDYADVTIPLGVRAPQGQELTFSILESSLPESTNVYLEDMVANTVTLLNEGNYTLTPTSNITGTGRFFLRFAESALSIEEVAFNSIHVFATATPKAIFIKGNLTDTTLVKVYDMQGRLVLSSSLESGSSNNQIDVSTLATGIYAVSISNKSLTKNQKVIIR